MFFGVIESVPRVWGIIFLGFALAAIPPDYSLSFGRALAWLVMLACIHVIGSDASGASTLIAFVIFALSGAVAGLPFEAGDGDLD